MKVSLSSEASGQTDRQTARQTDRQTYRQTDRQTDKNFDRISNHLLFFVLKQKHTHNPLPFLAHVTLVVAGRRPHILGSELLGVLYQISGSWRCHFLVEGPEGGVRGWPRVALRRRPALGMATGGAAPLGANPLSSLLAVCPFDAEACKPMEFDFRAHLADRKEKESGKDKKDKPLKRLPHRLLLSAFSSSVGHRPTGLQTAQAKMFVERFPSEFREMSMQKVVLPCNMDGSLPFVAPGGALPCPALSTFNALRYLQNHPEAMAKAEPRAKAQMERIWTKGVQVEWFECESFLQWQLHVETASVQASVQVAPHIIDTALKYLTFCNSSQAAGAVTSSSKDQDPCEQNLDSAFSKYLQGNSSHRLKEAKTLLNSSEPSVIAMIAKWRKGVHYLHANSLAQVYLLCTEEWSALHGKQVVLEKTTYSLQSVVAKQLMKTISDTEIVNTGEVPRLRRGAMTLAVFKELCTSVQQAVKYKAALHTEYAGVWGETGSAEKLFKRLIVSGEPALRQSFLRGLVAQWLLG